MTPLSALPDMMPAIMRQSCPSSSRPGITIDKDLEENSTVIQNLRLIKKSGINVWKQRDDIWNETALAEDHTGSIIYLYSETPVSMHHFNEILLSSGLDIVAAQHLDGGAPPEIYLKAVTTEINFPAEPGWQLPMPNII